MKSYRRLQTTVLRGTNDENKESYGGNKTKKTYRIILGEMAGEANENLSK